MSPPQSSDNDEYQPHLVISTNDTGIWRLAYLPDGQRVATSSDGGTVKVWNLESGEQEGTSMEHKNNITGLAVTRDGSKIISSYHGGVIKVWNVESHQVIEEWTHPGSYPKIAISPDDRLIAVGTIWRVGIYTMEGRQVNESIEVGEVVLSMCFSPDGKKLACGTQDDILVYAVQSGTLILRPLEVHQECVYDVLWSPDGSRLFSGSDDGKIRYWNSDTGEQIGHPWKGHTGWICSLSLSPDGSILATASSDYTVRFWDATTGNPIGQHLQHDEPVHAVRFSPCGEFVASAGRYEKIYLWRVPRLNPIKDSVTTPFMGVLALVLTLLQASSILSGIGDLFPGFDRLDASIFSIGSSVQLLTVLCSHLRQLVPLYLTPILPPCLRWNHSLICPPLGMLLHYTTVRCI